MGLVLVRVLCFGVVAVSLSSGALPASSETIYPMGPQAPATAAIPTADVSLLGIDAPRRPVTGALERVPDGHDGAAAFRVTGQQTSLRIDEPVFVTADTEFVWSWKKQQGTVCIMQVALRNPQTGQQRYLGYGAGSLTEPSSPDPTVEIWISPNPPREWTRVERNLLDDIRKLLGWDSAQITELYLSPWDGAPGLFADAAFHGVAAQDAQAHRNELALKALSAAGRGSWTPQRLKKADEKRVEKFDANFEECAPGRNNGANEWSAFGVDSGNKDFNCLGREMTVRYPVFDLVFRLYDGDKEIKPGESDSFRLGLMDNRFPAIWGGWQHEGLMYKVTAM